MSCTMSSTLALPSASPSVVNVTSTFEPLLILNETLILPLCGATAIAVSLTTAFPNAVTLDPPL